jgi:hypothetical protein
MLHHGKPIIAIAMPAEAHSTVARPPKWSASQPTSAEPQSRSRAGSTTSQNAIMATAASPAQACCLWHPLLAALQRHTRSWRTSHHYSVPGGPSIEPEHCGEGRPASIVHKNRSEPTVTWECPICVAGRMGNVG